jgi:hypothetical protein
VTPAVAGARKTCGDYRNAVFTTPRTYGIAIGKKF